jgi:O-antigen ligase
MMVIYTSIAAILQSKGIVVLRYDDSIIQNTRHVTSTLSYNYAHLGLFQLVTIGLLLGSLKDSRAILSKIAYAILIGIGIYVLMLSGSRTGMIGTTIVGFVLFAYSKNKTSYILASLVILALLYYIGLPEVFERRFSVIAEADSTGAGRVRSWLQLGDFFHVSAINTIFGVGFMQFKFSSAIDIFHSNAGHNNFLNAYVESGIIGLLLFLNIVIAVFARLKKYKDSSPLNLSMFAIWIGLVITCISVETLSVNFALTSFMGFLFVTLGFIQNHAETKDLPHHK